MNSIHSNRTSVRTGLKIGANFLPNGSCSFLVWAPFAEQVEVHLVHPKDALLPLSRDEAGYHSGQFDGIAPGTRYYIRLNGKQDLPDPASRYQPDGVHGPSEMVSNLYRWSDQNWRGIPLRDYIIYELHVGTFTPEGTFESIIPQLPALKELGINALEIMPIAQFPGGRNWGYDGVGLFAAQNSYGGPENFKKLVDACHGQGLAVILDVVYNHLGPEGNYLGQFGPYFTEAYRTPWGAALNFDGPHSNEVRRFFLENALYWQTDCHVDALRLDAVHAIRDFSAIPFLQELAERTESQAGQLHRWFHLIAESDLNNPRFILPPVIGGYGLDAQWSDDFHHCLHVLLTGERTGYYQDFGGVRQLGKIFKEGYAYTGEYSAHRKARHGASPIMTSLGQFVVCAQNHDQVGNRMTGERLAALLDFESLKLAASALLFSPFIPLLFMGEEHGEPAPFQYMTSHSDPALIEAVRKGRREEFASFEWQGEVPDPQAESTFLRSRVNHSLRSKGRHKTLFDFYTEAIRVRKEVKILSAVERDGVHVHPLESENALAVEYHSPGGESLLLLLGFGKNPASFKLALSGEHWHRLIDSSDEMWDGPGSLLPKDFQAHDSIEFRLQPRSAALFRNF